jgi:hypothetical protein
MNLSPVSSVAFTVCLPLDRCVAGIASMSGSDPTTSTSIAVSSIGGTMKPIEDDIREADAEGSNGLRNEGECGRAFEADGERASLVLRCAARQPDTRRQAGDKSTNLIGEHATGRHQLRRDRNSVGRRLRGNTSGATVPSLMHLGHQKPVNSTKALIEAGSLSVTDSA